MSNPVAEKLLEQLKAAGKTFCTAESCTGGLIGKTFTDVSGSSAVYEGGVISYSNEVKMRVLGVPEELLRQYGAVSSPVAKHMAEGALRVTGADCAVSVTGIAGPNSDGTGKPVGLVYIGTADRERTVVCEYHFQGNREEIRSRTCDAALLQLLSFTQKDDLPADACD